MKNYLNDGLNYQLKMKLGGVSQPSGKMVVNRNKLQSEKNPTVLCEDEVVWLAAQKEKISVYPKGFSNLSLSCFTTVDGTMRRY